MRADGPRTCRAIAVEEPDHRHRRLLRARRERPHAAAPPSSVMNSRRLIRSPRRRGRAASADLEQRLGGLEVDDEIEFGRLHDRQIGGFSALKDAAGVDAGADETRPQDRFRSSSARRLRQRSRWGKTAGSRVARRKRRKLHAPSNEEAVGRDEEGVGPVAHKVAKAASISPAGAGVDGRICSPRARRLLYGSQRGLGDRQHWPD